MKICIHDNRGNGQPLFAALEHAGHELVTDHGDVLLSDSDSYISPYAELCDSHDRVFLHPHGAGIIGRWSRHPHTRGQFVTAEGHQEILRREGYDYPTVAIGWHFCPLRDFQSSGMREAMRVILAPTHAMADGYIEPWVPPVTRRLHDWLADMPLSLTVRYVHNLAPLGLKQQPHVGYVQGNGMVQDAVAALEEADLVIGGTWTFPTLAIARGIPTLMYGQGVQDERIDDYVMAPLMVDGVPTKTALWELMALACQPQESVRRWRERFIGKPFDPSSFVDAFERAVKEW